MSSMRQKYIYLPSPQVYKAIGARKREKSSRAQFNFIEEVAINECKHQDPGGIYIYIIIRMTR